MSLSSHLVTRQCPNCHQDILASSSRCQFCHTEVAPTALSMRVINSSQPALQKTGPRMWQEIANTIIGVCWMASGGITFLAGFAAGVMGIFVIGSGALVFFLGLGIVRQQPTAVAFAKIACYIEVVLGLFRLAASAATQGTPAASWFPPGVALAILAIAAFQAYIFWCVGD